MYNDAGISRSCPNSLLVRRRWHDDLRLLLAVHPCLMRRRWQTQVSSWQLSYELEEATQADSEVSVCLWADRGSDVSALLGPLILCLSTGAECLEFLPGKLVFIT